MITSLLSFFGSLNLFTVLWENHNSYRVYFDKNEENGNTVHFKQYSNNSKLTRSSYFLEPLLKDKIYYIYWIWKIIIDLHYF